MNNCLSGTMSLGANLLSIFVPSYFLTVTYHHGGSLSVVRSEHFAYELSIQEIAQHKGYKANEKCYHRS